jgi:2-oxoglutarate dehydrogenase E1 component
MSKKKDWVLRDLIATLENTYCKKIGIEFMHMSDRNAQKWIREKFEDLQFSNLTVDEKVHMFERLNWADAWGNFLAKKFNTVKRFDLQGNWSFIPGLKFLIDKMSELGGETYIMGMAHRGRLNTLANVVRKPAEVLMAEANNQTPDETLSDGFKGDGDAKYHLGTTYKRMYPNGKEISITLLANPSHLETVNPVVQGRTRAEQHFLGGGE